MAAVGGHLETWRPDVVVRDETDLGTPLAAELAGVPCATVVILAAGTLAKPALVSPRLEALRHELGLAPDPELATLSRDLVLSAFPPVVPRPVGAAAPDARSPTAPGPSRPRRADRSSTSASARSSTPARATCSSACSPGWPPSRPRCSSPSGADIDPADFGEQPAHITVERYVAQADVLPRCALVVSHGGSGSLMGALEHGLPSVLTPLGADQPHNAVRAAELGVATSLDAAAVTPTEIEHAVTAMLGDARARETALELKAEIDALPPVEATVPLLERLAGH